MNKRMNDIQRAMLIVLAAGVLCTAVMAQSVQKSDDEHAATSALSKLSDQINIMRVLITNSINEGPFAERYQEAVEAANAQAKKELAEELDDRTDAELIIATHQFRDLYTNLNNSNRRSFTSHTRGFYAAGVGVLFSTEISVPVRQVTVEEQENEQQAPDEPDEWEAAAAESRGSNLLIREYAPLVYLNREKSTTRWEIDPVYIEDAIMGVTEKIATFGTRLSDLPASESFIVAMRFEPDGASSSWPVRVGSNSESVVIASQNYLPLASLGSGSRRAQILHITVQIPMSLVQQVSSGAMTVQELRDAATVTAMAQGRDKSFFGIRSGNLWRSSGAVAPTVGSGGQSSGR